MSFLIDVLNGVQKLVSATPAAVGAEPALSDPGPGTWYLRSIGAIRSWVAQIPWAGIDKTGAVASDIGALPEIVVTGSVNFNSINSDLPCSAEISPSIVTNGPFGYAAPTKAHLLQSKGAANYLTQVLTTATAVAFRGMTSPGVWGSWRYVWDDANLPISALGLDLLNDLTAYSMRLTLGALASANPTATGTLTAPDVVVSNRAGAGTRMATLDSTGKIGAEEKPYRDNQFVQSDVAGTSTLKTFTVWNWLTGAAELVIAGSFNNSNGTYSASSTVSVYHGAWLLASVSVTIPVSGNEAPFKIRITPSSVGGFNQAIADVQTPTGTQITRAGDDESASTAIRIECTNAYNQQESRIHNVSIL